MSNICIVASCNTRRTPNTDKTSAIKCFSFPKDPDLKRQWLHLCQVDEDCNRKVCIKHFKEDDFVDGLKARLMSMQPTRLKKDAVPSLFLSPERLTEESKQNFIQNQKLLEKLMCKKKKKQLRITATKDPNVTISNPSEGSMEYLSKLVPIAPKGQKAIRGRIVAPKERLVASVDPLLAQKWPKIAVKESILKKEEPKCREEQVTSLKDTTITRNAIPKMNIKQPSNTVITTTRNGKVKGFVEQQLKAGFSVHQLKTLQQDNDVYKMRINSLIDNQNKLLARIKELEATIEGQNDNFLCKAKETFGHVLTSNQIDSIVGKRKQICWTDEEYSKALDLIYISKQAYNHVRQIMNYPLPCIPNVYRWSAKLALRKSDLEENRDDKAIEGKTVLNDDELVTDEDIKSEVKNECKEYLAENIEYVQDLDDKDDFTKMDVVKIDQCNIECEVVDYDDDNDNEHSDTVDAHDNNDQSDKTADEYSIDCDKISFVNDEHDISDHYINDNDINDHDINDHDISDADQNDEFYEVLVIDNYYSEDDEMFDRQKDECIEKDNG